MYSWLKLFAFVLFVIEFTNAQKLETIHQWKKLNYGFPTTADQKEAIDSGNLIIENTIPIEVAPHYLANGTRRVIVSSPRFMDGVPYTLATVGAQGQLQPYPDYSWHSSRGANCDEIGSAFRVAFTPCNQMWVIDAGAGSGNCAPQLLLFDLTTDKLVYRYRFPSNLYLLGGSHFVNLAIKVDDPKGKCEKTTVYVADDTFHSLVVYDHAQKAGWLVEHRFMYPDPDKGKITLAGTTFTLMDALFGLNVDGKYLYFYPLASDKQYRVPLSILADRTAFEQDKTSHSDQFKKVGNRGTGCAASANDSRHNIYCVGFNPVGLLSWNTGTSYNKQNLRTLSREEDLLQFASGMKVVKNPKGKEELWILTNRYQKFAVGATNYTEINYRILKRDLF